jgi:Dpy-30 motif
VNGQIASEADADDLISSFTETGYPGEYVRLQFENAKKFLSVPLSVKKAFAASSGRMEASDGRDLSTFVRSGFVTLFPSFVNLLQTLTEQNRPFSIILHGTEAETDAAFDELSVLCEGVHPCYSGNNKTARFQYTGEILRLSGDITTTLTFEGSEIQGIQKTHATLVYEICERSKIIFLANNDNRMTGTYYDDRHAHQIYLSNDPSSVKLIDPISENELVLAEVAKKAFVRIDPIQAALENDYFVRAVSTCESELRAYLDDLARRPMQPPEQPLTPRSYLNKHVLPTLLPVIELCCRDRPSDPLSYIAANLWRYEPTGFREVSKN